LKKSKKEKSIDHIITGEGEISFTEIIEEYPEGRTFSKNN